MDDLLVVPGSPAGATTELFGTSFGSIYHSATGGASWQLALAGNAGSDARLSPSLWPGGQLYASVSSPADPGNPPGIYYCDPAQPLLWTAMAGNAALPTFNGGRLDCLPNGRLYAYLINSGNAAAFVTASGPGAALTSPLAAGSLPVPDGNAPFWGLALRVTPNSSGAGSNDVLLLGTIGLSRSADGGASWQDVPSIPHSDLHAFVFADPPSGSTVPVSYLGCDGGVARSYLIADPTLANLSVSPADYGDGQTAAAPASQSWLWENMNHGLVSSGSAGYASPPGYPALSYLACQDTSIAMGNGALGFRQAYGMDGDCRAIAAAASPSGVAVWAINGSPFTVVRTLDDGHAHPNTVQVTIGTGANPDHPFWPDSSQTIDLHKFEVDSQGRAVAGVLTETGRLTVISIDPSGQATPIHSDLPSEPLQIAIDPQSSAVFCSSDDGRIFHTSDGNAATTPATDWTDLSTGRPADVAVVYALAVTTQTSTLLAMAGSAHAPAPAPPQTLGLYQVPLTGGWAQQTLSPAIAEDWAPANVRLVADPDNDDQLFLGQGRRVYQLNRAPSTSTWQVTDLSDFELGSAGALPGGYVNELWVGKVGTRTVLRAAIPARGIWEREATTAPAGEPTVYLRNHPADLGWAKPGPEGSPSPFGSQAGTLGHWLSPDIKVEMFDTVSPAAPYQTDPEYPDPLTTSLDHVAFDMLRSDASGMTADTAARVHVQVHQRAYTPAAGMSLWVIYCDAAMMVPTLPGAFWSRFHADGTIDNSALTGGWTEVGPPKPLPAPSAGAPTVLSWDWAAPQSIPAGSHYCLFAIAHGPAPYDVTAQATGASVDAIVPTNTQIGQRNVFWLPLGGSPSPPTPWLRIPKHLQFPLQFHNPFAGEAEAEIEFNALSLLGVGNLAVNFTGRSARFLDTGVVARGRRLKLGDRARAHIAMDADDDDRGEGHRFRPNRTGHLHIRGLALPAHAHGFVHIDLQLRQPLQPGRSYTIDATQTITDANGDRVAGGATLILGAGRLSG